MQTHVEDRRASRPEIPEGLVRPHDTSTLVRAALLMQREAGIERATAFLQESGVSDEIVVRVLHHGKVREQDSSH